MIRRITLYICLFFSFYINITSLKAQVIINEIMSSNGATAKDNFDNYSDWIELYNAGSTAVDLSGYYLSDNALDIKKWKFPELSLAPNSYQIVWASGKDTSILSNSTHFETVLSNQSWKYLNPTSEEIDWKNNTYNDENWTISNCPIGYGDPEVELATSLTLTNKATLYLRKSFNVVDKAQITGLLFYMAYDDGFAAYLNGVEIAREDLSSNPDYDEYTGNAINEPEPLEFAISSTILENVLIEGENILAIEVHNTSSTSSDLLANPFLIANIANKNIVYSSTLPSFFSKTSNSKSIFHTNFSLSSTGETVVLSDSNGTVLNVLPAQALNPDHSWGRSTNGGSTNTVFSKPSFKASNTSGTAVSGYTTGKIQANLNAGFYSNTQSITLSYISGGSGETIRYTTNGSKPTSSSTAYTEPISVSSSTVIRAASFASGKTPPIENYFTNTYIIGSKPSLNVIFLSGNPSDIEPSPNDSPTSIYAEGPNAGTCGYTDPPYSCYNYYQDWEKEVHVEFLTTQNTNGSQAFEVDAGAHIYGGWSRISVIKSMAIEMKGIYGSKEGVDYQLFKNKSATNYTSFALRNGGNDLQGTILRDAVNHVMIEEDVSKAHWNIDYESYEPVIVYMNGKYFGIHQMRERTDDSYPLNNHGVDKYEMVESRGEDEGVLVAREGTTDQWEIDKDFIINNDMSIQANFDSASSLFDIKNLVDYFALETFSGNWDWPHNNVRVWKPKDEGKWRYIVHDMDFSFDLQSIWGISTSENNELKRILNKEGRDWNGGGYKPSQHVEIIRSLMKNENFKTYFINRYADLLNTAFNTDNTIKVWDELVSEIDPEISKHAGKWSSNTGLTNNPQSTAIFAQGNGKSGWLSYCSSVKNKISNNTVKVRNNIEDYFTHITDQISTTLESSPSNGGLIKVNSIAPPSLPWTGVYFEGNAITLTALSNSGFSFSSWTITGASIISGNVNSPTITVNLTSTSTIKANYVSSSNSPKVIVSEINYNSFEGFSAGDWIELYNAGNADQDISGWKIRDNSNYRGYEIEEGTHLGPGEYLVIAKDLKDFKKIHPTVNNVQGEMNLGLSSSGDKIRVIDAAGREIINFNYGTSGSWPASANGQGATLDLISSNNDPSLAASWRAGCQNGTPGRAYQTYSPSLDIIASASSICFGDSIKIKINNKNIGISTTYQWQKNNANVTNATNKNIVLKQVSESGNYTLKAAVNDVCATKSVVTSNSVAIDIKQILTPNITIDTEQGTNVNQYSKPKITVAVENGGTSPIITWYKNNSIIPNESNGTIILNSVENGDEIYAMLNSNLDCTTKSTATSNKLTFLMLVSLDEKSNEQLSFYPNPVTDKLIIDTEDDTEVSILNQLGETIETHKGNKLDLSHLSSGIYILQLKKDQNTYLSKFIKE